MKEHKNNMSRRHFLGAGLAATAFALSGCHIGQGKKDLLQYESNLRDRLWMWGHGAGTVSDVVEYNVPGGNKIDMADAIDYMGIPNVHVVRWRGKPEPPFDEYVKQFRKTKRVTWSIVDGAPQSYGQKKQWAFELVEKMPNLVGFSLDDFFQENYILSVDQLRALRKEMDALKRNINLSLVLYSHELGLNIKNHIDCVDDVLFWTWHATDLVKLEENFNMYRSIVPGKPTFLGIYMWDFGNAKPVPLELMKLQLDFALEKFKQHEIKGMIFHCTPLVDIGLEAVEYSKKWIAKYGDMER